MLLQRIYALDYLRGLCAVSIMVYHFFTWGEGEFHASHFLAKMGRYGVAIFYVLSGLTLYYVYSNYKFDTKGLKKFFLRRVFRIFPLLNLVIILTLVANTLRGEEMVSLLRIVLNVTGLFSVLAWDQYIGIGTWSIGNELSFYLLFPVLLILLSKENRIGYSLLFLGALVAYLYFGFVVISPDQALSEQWHQYTNPLNQVFLFVSGIFIGKLFLNREINQKVTLTLLVASIALFVFMPVNGETVLLVQGWHRVLFTVLSILICLLIFKLKVPAKGWIHKTLVFLGDTSYSVYLLHPLVWAVLTFAGDRFGLELSIPIKIIVGFCITPVVSALVYFQFEKRVAAFGRNLIK